MIEKDIFIPLKPEVWDALNNQIAFGWEEEFVRSLPSKRGVVKEEQFHDITVDGVRKTVDLTCEAICLVWQEIHGKDRPTWLPSPDELGRFPGVQVELRSVDHVGS